MFGWAKTKQHAWFTALTFIIAGTIMSAVKFTPFLSCIVGIMVGLSLVSISLIISRDHHFTFSDLFTPLLSAKRVLKFALLTLIYVASVMIGTVLLIVPGIYIAVRFKFFPFIAVEHENASIEDLIKMTEKVTRGHFWPVLAFLLLATLLNILGALLLVVGLFVTVPVTLFATAHVYNKLKDHTV